MHSVTPRVQARSTPRGSPGRNAGSCAHRAWPARVAHQGPGGAGTPVDRSRPRARKRGPIICTRAFPFLGKGTFAFITLSQTQRGTDPRKCLETQSRQEEGPVFWGSPAVTCSLDVGSTVAVHSCSRTVGFLWKKDMSLLTSTRRPSRLPGSTWQR